MPIKTSRILPLGVLAFFTILLVASAPAENSPPEAKAFQDWKSRFESANDPGQQTLIEEGVSKAHHRRNVLRELIKTNPKAALELSHSLTNQESLPLQVRAELENHFSTNGDFLIQCPFPAQTNHHPEPLRRFLKIGDKTYRAYAYGWRLGGISQTNVPVQGIEVDGAAAMENLSDTPIQEPSPPSAYTTGAKNVLVIRVDFSDLAGAPQGFSAATVLSTATSQVAPYYATSSYGLTSLAFTVSSNVYRLPQTAAYYATNDANTTLHTDAETLAGADYTVANYDRVIVYFASLGHLTGSQITYGGLADVGAKRVWCNGEFDFRVIAHELGHTYGLYHGDLWQVSDGNTISPSGVDTDYGDDFDTMGANYANDQRTDFGPWFKNILGWLGDTQVLTVTSNGTYRIYAFDHNNSAAAPGETLALKIVKDSTYNYWIGCRGDFTNNSSMSNGVYIDWGYNYTRTSDLLDMTTPGNSDQDAGLFFGATFIDAAAAGGQGISIQPLDRGGTAPNEYRDVKITFGVAPPSVPVFIGNPANASGIIGTTVSFTATANGNPLPTFSWQRKPAGTTVWQTLSDGGNYSGSTTTNLTVTLAALSMTGDQFQCVAANSAGSATNATAATLTVTTALYISTLAGQPGVNGSANGTGSGATFGYPWGIVCDNSGNIYVSQYGNGTVRKVTPSGVVTTFATGFSGPESLAMDANTNLYVCDTLHQQIKRIATTGVSTVLAGSQGVEGSQDGTGTGATFGAPWGIAVDSQTNIYVSDNASNIIRKITRIGTSANWAVTTIAGTPGVTGSANGTNSSASFHSPAGLACDASDNIYVADSGNECIRKITPDATKTIFTVSTYAGTPGTFGNRSGAATNAIFGYVYGLAFDGAGNLYATDDGGYNQILVISTNGNVTSIAGPSQQANGTNDGFYTAAQFNSPYGITVDKFGNVYISDTFNYTIRTAHYAQVTTPSLAINLSGTNALLSWPVPTQVYRLQSNTNLSTTNWNLVTNVASTVTNYNTVTNSSTNKTIFYRLVNP